MPGAANVTLRWTRPGGTLPLLQFSDITYVGYYDLNLSVGQAFYGTTMAIRYVNNSPRMLLSLFNGNNAATRPIVEVDIANATLNGTISTAINTWYVDNVSGSPPVWQQGEFGQSNTNGACETILWDNNNNVLLRSSYIAYPDSFIQAWLDVLDVPTSGGSITRQKRLNVGTLMDSAIANGFSLIPSQFQSEYGTGAYALGTGTYRSKTAQFGTGSPVGFTTYSVPNISGYSNGSTLPTTNLSLHTPSVPGKKMWFGYTFTQTGTYTFTSTEVNAPGGIPAYAGVTVPSGTFSSTNPIVGPLDYLASGGDPRGNGQNGPQPVWDITLVNPSNNGVTYGNVGNNTTYYGWGDTYAGHAFIYGPTKRGILAVGAFAGGGVWYGNSSVRRQNFHLEMHIIDPLDLGKVINGTLPATSVNPVDYKLVTEAPAQGEGDSVPCVAWDSTAKKLYVFYTQLYSGGYANRIHVYSVNV